MRVLEGTDLGQLAYEPAYQIQVARVEEVVGAREGGGAMGTLYFVEHVPPVITVSRRPGAAAHLLASPQLLAAHGVEVCETDRGGDITYHGPGQLVAYPILDLNIFNLGLHEYMRLLEESVIETCAHFGIEAQRDPTATGVWVNDAKICAMGVRVRKWVSMHGLAINVHTDLSHFGHIVPCGLAGRPVTSMRRLLGDACPSMMQVREVLSERLHWHLLQRAQAVAARRAVNAAAAQTDDGTSPADSSR
ncbi:MAG: lipoyl(octanoyl) transferase LipB [Planctomycetota bacterium]|nr:lipoyl(octanoyl) transferase LipB [Planctomycetota bacterium]